MNRASRLHDKITSSTTTCIGPALEAEEGARKKKEEREAKGKKDLQPNSPSHTLFPCSSLGLIVFFPPFSHFTAFAFLVHFPFSLDFPAFPFPCVVTKDLLAGYFLPPTPGYPLLPLSGGSRARCFPPALSFSLSSGGEIRLLFSLRASVVAPLRLARCGSFASSPRSFS